MLPWIAAIRAAYFTCRPLFTDERDHEDAKKKFLAFFYVGRRIALLLPLFLFFCSDEEG